MGKLSIDEKNYNFAINLAVIETWTNKISRRLHQKLEINIESEGILRASFYALQDSQNVVDQYKQLNNQKMESINYLSLYGVLQALFVQQDSLKDILKWVTGIKFIDWKFEYYELWEIREIRNRTIGHPTNNKGNFYLLSQITLNKYGYRLVKNDKSNKIDSELVKIYDLLIMQEKGILDIMARITKEISKKMNY